MKNLFSLTDKVVFITGGNRNIGAVLTEGFASCGAKVVVGNTQRHKADEILAKLDQMGADYLWVPLDVSNKQSVTQAFDAVIQRYGCIDVLINNAAVRVNEIGLEHGEDKWDWLFGINVKGSMLCSQAAANIMKRQGGGKIINTSSIFSYLGSPMRTSYCASKAAINGYTAATAVEWGQYNIFVNALAWGAVNIPHIPYPDMPDGQKKSVAMAPLGKLQDAKTLFGAAAFLASDASNGMTGQVLLVDSGWSVMAKPADLDKDGMIKERI